MTDLKKKLNKFRDGSGLLVKGEEAELVKEGATGIVVNFHDCPTIC